MNKFQRTVVSVIFAIIVMALFAFALFHTTSAEYWYSDMHDEYCERMLHGDTQCQCYERLLESEK